MKVVIFFALFEIFGLAVSSPTALKGLSFGPIGSNGVLSQIGKITGGFNATAGELPWQVSMQVKPIFGEKYHTCGGTILNENHVSISDRLAY